MMAAMDSARPLSVSRIVSGGQTGVDQAALQFALDRDLAHGGWCPRGRFCETGPIPDQFQLRESHSRKYWVRTEQNVIDSDGTLILFRGELSGGTAFTYRMTVKHRRPCLRIDLAQPVDPAQARHWLHEHDIVCLNVAGPRQSTAPGIDQQARKFLDSVFRL